MRICDAPYPYTGIIILSIFLLWYVLKLIVVLTYTFLIVEFHIAEAIFYIFIGYCNVLFYEMHIQISCSFSSNVDCQSGNRLLCFHRFQREIYKQVCTKQFTVGCVLLIIINFRKFAYISRLNFYTKILTWIHFKLKFIWIWGAH